MAFAIDRFTGIIKTGRKFWRKFKKFLKMVIKQYPIFAYLVELSLLYAYANITLLFLVQNSLGLFPEGLELILPFARPVLSFELFKFIASPEKTLLIYLIISEIVFRSKSVEILFQYNFLLVFLLEMIQGIMISLWDIFCRRDMVGMLPEELIIARYAEVRFFSLLYLLFFGIYMYCYIKSLFFQFPEFIEPFDGITDSVGFWFRIDRRKKKKNR